MSPRELPPIEGRVLPFRRPSAAVRVRRRSLWASLGRPFLQALAMVGLPAAAVTWALTTPSFALDSVEVAGNHRVEQAWVESALAPLHGRNLLTLALDEVRARVAAHPWVAVVTVEKRLPDRLEVSIEERRPVALLRADSGLVYLDGEGRPIAPYEPGRGPADLLLVAAAEGREWGLVGAVAVAEELAAAAPSWADTLSEVEALGGEDYRLDLGALPFPLLVRRGTLAERLPAFARLLPELERRYQRISYVDLRSDRRIVFQPVVERS